MHWRASSARARPVRRPAVVLPSLAELEYERDTAQTAYRDAEARGGRAAAAAALERFNAAARRYNDAKLHHFESGE